MFIIDWRFLLEVLLRLFLAVVIGLLIGSERAKHGRAAGMRTHTLVALGSCLTSLMSVYISQILGSSGDIMRISAQVVSGIGFLGAGMIIIKNNDIITGLTTAAGVWTTSIIGIALGYGFYEGAILCTGFFLLAVILFSKFEKRRRPAETIYVEISDLYKTNDVVDDITEMMDGDLTYTIVPAKSGTNGHVGLIIILGQAVDSKIFRKIDAVAFVTEE
jgi:putative Mg2+ transporter-C (MgtC) family protein